MFIVEHSNVKYRDVCFEKLECVGRRLLRRYVTHLHAPCLVPSTATGLPNIFSEVFLADNMNGPHGWPDKQQK